MAKNILNNLNFYSGLLFPVIQHTRHPEWLSWRKQLRHWEIKSIILNALLEKTLESLGQQGNQPWIFSGRTDAEAEAPILWLPDNEESTHWKRPWCWKRLRTGGEGVYKGWDS